MRSGPLQTVKLGDILVGSMSLKVSVKVISHPCSGMGLKSLFAILLFISFAGFAPQTQGAGTSGKTWATFGTNPKLDEPNVDRVDLAQEVPLSPDKYRWTVTARRSDQANTVALAYEYDDFNGMGVLRTVPFGTEILPISIKAFKKTMYYLYDSGSGKRFWISGEFLKISLK